MANKKLKVELELETAKAKQQLVNIGEGAGQSGTGSSTRSLDRLSEATKLNTNQMLSMTRAFSGLALGLAASYSSNYFEKGSSAEKAIGYIGSILSGASMGAMAGAPAGPAGMAVGASVGGGVGAAKEYMDREKAIADAMEDYKHFEEVLGQNTTFSNFIKRMTSPFNYESIETKLSTMSDYYSNLNNIIELLTKEIEDSLADGRLEDARKSRETLGRIRGYKEKLVSVAETMDNSSKGPLRASMTATDSLMKIGGGFGLSFGSNRGDVEVLSRGIDVQNALLRDIRENTMKKGSTWL